MAWKNPPTNFKVRVFDDVDKVSKKLAGQILTSVIAATPVDTSQARGNWRVGINLINEEVIAGANTGSLQQGLTAIVGASKKGKIIYITNSLKYIRRLNNGWSDQAPKNFVQLAVRGVVEKNR